MTSINVTRKIAKASMHAAPFQCVFWLTRLETASALSIRSE